MTDVSCELLLALERCGLCMDCHDRLLKYLRTLPHERQLKALRSKMSLAYLLPHDEFHAIMAKIDEAGD